MAILSQAAPRAAIVLVAVLLAYSPPALEAQAVPVSSRAAGSGAARPMRFERLSVDHGLSQSTATAVVQDSRTGLLWIGTQDGLNRYDG